MSKSNKFDLININRCTAFMVFIFTLFIIAKAIFFAMKFETAVEILLGLIVGYFVFHAVILITEQQNSVKSTNDALNNLISHIGKITIIKTSEEYYRELRSSITNAKDSVCLLYLTKSSPVTIGKNSQNYWEWFQKYIQVEGKKVVVKRIASLDTDDKINWLIAKTVELAQSPNYGIRVFNPKSEKVLPLIGLEIIDRNEIFLFGPHGKTPRWIYIKNPDVAEGMAQYFDELWSKLSTGEIKGIGAFATTETIEACIKKCCNS